MAGVGFGVRRAEKPVEPRLIAEAQERTGANHGDEHVPVARLPENGSDPLRLGPQGLEIIGAWTAR